MRFRRGIQRIPNRELRIKNWELQIDGQMEALMKPEELPERLRRFTPSVEPASSSRGPSDTGLNSKLPILNSQFSIVADKSKRCESPLDRYYV